MRFPRAAILLLTAMMIVSGVMGADVPAAPVRATRVTFATSEIKLKPGRLGKIEVTFQPVEGKAIKWINLADDLDLIPSESGKWAVITSLTPKTYRVAAYSATTDGQPTDPTYCTIIVEGETPPGPAPGPTPPAPIDDPLLSVLSPIFGADQSPTKREDVLKLASVYDLASTTTVVDPAVTTRSQLVSVIVTAGRSVCPLPKLQTMREKIATELDAKLGTDPASPLTADLRSAYAVQFARMAKLLKTLGGN